MTIDETIDIFKREKAHCKEHLHFVGKSEEYYNDIRELVDAYDLSIKMLEKVNKLKVTYICDGERCQECYDYCRHTTDISHAKNFKPVMSVDGKATSYYEEVEE